MNPARPPATTDDGTSFDKTAGLKRFHSHSHQLHTFLHNAGWEGGLSKITRSIALDQNSNNRNCTRDLDPPTHQKQCKFVRLTPLRSVRHHNHAVNPARPPATTDDGTSFDKTAGLKRFHSHSFSPAINPVTSRKSLKNRTAQKNSMCCSVPHCKKLLCSFAPNTPGRTQLPPATPTKRRTD